MKRTLPALLAAAAVTTALVSPASAAPRASSDRDTSGPACLDVLDGRRAYSGTQLTVTLELAAPACPQATYTLVVEENGVARTFLSPVIDPVTGNPVFTVTTSGSPIVKIYATTALGGRVFDRAPDGGTIDVASDGSSPGLRMR